MTGMQVAFFRPKMSSDSLKLLAEVNSDRLEPKSARLGKWLRDQIINEVARRASDGEIEPGCPRIDLHRWTDSQIADGLECSFLLSQWGEPLDLGLFSDKLLQAFCIAARSSLKARQ